MPTERERLESLLTSQEASIRRAFNAFLADTRSDTTIREVRELLQRNDIDAALSIVDTHVITLGNVIPRTFVNTANAEVAALGARRNASVSRISVSFDPTQERAAEIMRTSRLNFVEGFTREQRAVTREALADSFRQGSDTRSAALAFRDSIGLTSAQHDMVDNYRNLLTTQSSQALGRELRDRRFDPTIERMLESGEPLEPAQIERMVDRYRERFLSYRAENIARTESLRVMSEARQEALDQMLEHTGIDEALVVRTWHATKDKRTRDTHREMDGQQVGLNEPFQSPSGALLMYPGDPSAPAEEIINCRCTITIEFATTPRSRRAA